MGFLCSFGFIMCCFLWRKISFLFLFVFHDATILCYLLFSLLMGNTRWKLTRCSLYPSTQNQSAKLGIQVHTWFHIKALRFTGLLGY